jgi:predicted ribosomally synthesized peptide with nif11-like leader
MSYSDIQPIKASDLSAEELQLQKAQQAINDLFIIANHDEALKRQLEAAISPGSLVEIAARQGYELTIADLETLRHRTQEPAHLNSDELDEDELSEQELELVAGGGFFSAIKNIIVPRKNKKTEQVSVTTGALGLRPH